MSRGWLRGTLDRHPGAATSLWLALCLAACGAPVEELSCVPACPAGTHCTAAGCASDDPNRVIDLAVAVADMAGCPTACGGATPHCSPERACVACLEDSHCPTGQVCRAAAGSRLCLPGCNDDARCGAGRSCCNSTCVETSKDAANCGACAVACMTAHGSASCVNGKCVAGPCAAGWGDCNMDGAQGDGCETNLRSDIKNCKACGAACDLKNAISACASGCYIAACLFGFDDCDINVMNGCETPVAADAKNCGACNNVCAAIPRAKNGCINGSCQVTQCDAGWSNCDGDVKNGCEIATGTDARNCGVCGTVCPQGAVCIAGSCTCPPCNFPNAKAKCAGVACVIDTCLPNFGDCDGLPQNGCERALAADAQNCGACGNVCPMGLVCAQGGCTCPKCNIPNAKTKCINNVCVLDACLPGWDNCDNFAGNGCEADVSSDAKNCGACGVACPQNAPFCTGGKCNNVLKSCLELWNAGGRQNGLFLIDADGAGPLPQTQVYCDMNNGGQTLYGVAHAWGEWGANMFIVIRDRLNPEIGALNDWQATCQLFNKAAYVGSWKNNGGTYSAMQFKVWAESNDWWTNFALKVMPDAIFDKILILQDSQSPNCWAWYAEAGSLSSFGSPQGGGFAFCRNGNTAKQRFHIYLCL